MLEGGFKWDVQEVWRILNQTKHFTIWFARWCAVWSLCTFWAEHGRVKTAVQA